MQHGTAEGPSPANESSLATGSVEQPLRSAPGLYGDVEADDYHRGPGVSKSDLDQIARSPAHYRARKAALHEPTSAMRLGTAVHTAILEPDRFEAEYVVAPSDMNKRTKAWKEWQAAHADHEVLDASQHAQVLAMRDAVMSHPYAGPLLDRESGPVEQTCYWWETVELDGGARRRVLCKARPDKLNDAHQLAVDLKTSSDASFSGFAKSVTGYRYHVQEQHYLRGLRAAGHAQQAFVFVAIESVAPYAVGVYVLDEDARQLGRTLRERDLRTFARCLAHDAWPGYPPEIRTLSLPRWARSTPAS